MEIFADVNWEIIDALTAADIKITMIYSNGLLIDENFCSELERRHLRIGFQISFDGLNGCHDWLCSVDGVEESTLRTIKLLSERNFPVSVAVDLHKGNIFAFRETVKTPADLGAEFLIAGTIDKSGEAVGMSDKILTTEELYNFVLSYIPQYLGDYFKKIRPARLANCSVLIKRLASFSKKATMTE